MEMVGKEGKSADEDIVVLGFVLAGGAVFELLKLFF